MDRIFKSTSEKHIVSLQNDNGRTISGVTVVLVHGDSGIEAIGVNDEALVFTQDQLPEYLLFAKEHLFSQILLVEMIPSKKTEGTYNLKSNATGEPVFFVRLLDNKDSIQHVKKYAELQTTATDVFHETATDSKFRKERSEAVRKPEPPITKSQIEGEKLPRKPKTPAPATKAENDEAIVYHLEKLNQNMLSVLTIVETSTEEAKTSLLVANKAVAHGRRTLEDKLRLATAVLIANAVVGLGILIALCL